MFKNNSFLSVKKKMAEIWWIYFWITWYFFFSKYAKISWVGPDLFEVIAGSGINHSGFTTLIYLWLTRLFTWCPAPGRRSCLPSPAWALWSAGWSRTSGPAPAQTKPLYCKNSSVLCTENWKLYAYNYNKQTSPYFQINQCSGKDRN